MSDIINIITKGQTKVKSIKVYRAQLLDSIVGKPLAIGDAQEVSVPYDIDDLDVSEQNATGILNKTSTNQEYLAGLRDIATLNPLNWQNAGSTQYTTDLKSFSSALKQEYTKAIKGLVAGINDDAKFKEQVIEVDVTQYSSIKSITRDLNFNNIAIISVSLPQLRSVAPTTAFSGTLPPLARPEFIPKENDVVEIIMQYPDGAEDRVFLGMVGLINMSERYGDITELTLTCYGLAKMLTTNMMVADRGVVSQFEDGSLSETGLSVWSTNAFAGSSVQEIFSFIMQNQLATRPTDLDANTDERYRLSIETSIMANSGAALEARFRELSTLLGEATIQIIERRVNTKTVDNGLEFIDGVQFDANRDGFGNQTVESLKEGVQETTNAISRRFPTEVATSDEREVATILLVQAQLKERDISISDRLHRLDREIQDASTPLPLLRFNFKFNTTAFTDITEFQLLYVPLITMMVIRGRQSSKQFDGNLVGQFRGKQANAFDILIRTGFRLYFSQLQTPAQILDGLRTTAKFQVYENELNQIIAEIPRYNDFAADNGENIEDFIINNPLSTNISRQDMNLVSRVDVKAYIPFIGAQDNALIIGQYTDAAALSRYGMRAQDPVYNPNVGLDTLTPNIFSAIETTIRNADTRTATVEVNADRRYRLGRLYFVRRETLDTLLGDAPDDKTTPTILDGYVGYLYGYDTNITAGSPITHTLAFKYVRKAKLIVAANADNVSTVVADFKILPDISGLIDIIEEGVKDGTITKEKFVGQTPQPPPEEANTRNAPKEENIYTTTVNIPSVFSSFINLADTHHKFIPPNDVDTKQISVLRVGDTGGGIKKELVRALHIIDTRIRPFNKTLFTTSLTVNNLGSTALTNKRAVFTAKYIPTFEINQLYKLTSLVGMKVSFIDAVNPILTKTMASVTSMGTFTDNTGAAINAVVFANGPIAASSTANRFAVLALSVQNFSEIMATILPSSGFAAANLTRALLKMITDIPAELTSSVKARDTGDVSATNINLFTSTEVKSAFRQNIINKAQALEPALSDTEINTVIDKLPDNITSANGSTARVLLPVILYGSSLTSNVIVNNANPGLPFSLYDAGVCNPFKFDTVEDLTKDAGNFGKAHSRGIAIDVTLLPYFARIGMFLKDFSPYILDKGYHPSAVGSHNQMMTDIGIDTNIGVTIATLVMNNPRSPFQTISQAWTIAQTDPSIIMKGMDSPNASNDILTKIGVSSVITTSDLSPADRRIYHIEAPSLSEALRDVPEGTKL